MRDIIYMNIHIDKFLSIYFNKFDKTKAIYCLRKNNKCILLVIESDKNLTKVFVHNLLISKNDVILQSYTAEKILKSMNNDICGYVDMSLNQGYKLSILTK